MPPPHPRINRQGSSDVLSLRELHRELQSAVMGASKTGRQVAVAFIHVDGMATGPGAELDPWQAAIFRQVLDSVSGTALERGSKAIAIDQRILLLLPCESIDSARIFCDVLRDEWQKASRMRASVPQPVTLSIGLAYPEPECAPPVASALMSQAATRARAAVAAGGDRVVCSEPEAAPETPPATQTDGRAPCDAGDQDAEQSELLRTRRELAQVRADLARAQRKEVRVVDDDRTRLLERRIQKLLATVQQTEDELHRVTRMQQTDSGERSIYREVQGLSGKDERFGQKLELMRAIFDANVEIQHPAGPDDDRASA